VKSAYINLMSTGHDETIKTTTAAAVINGRNAGRPTENYQDFIVIFNTRISIINNFVDF